MSECKSRVTRIARCTRTSYTMTHVYVWPRVDGGTLHSPVITNAHESANGIKRRNGSDNLIVILVYISNYCEIIDTGNVDIRRGLWSRQSWVRAQGRTYPGVMNSTVLKSNDGVRVYLIPRDVYLEI